jgi:hypothetical protein
MINLKIGGAIDHRATIAIYAYAIAVLAPNLSDPVATR